MAKNTHIIEVRTIGAKKAQSQIKGVGSSMRSMAAKATAAVAAAYAFGKAIQIATDLAKQSAQVKALERGFDSLGSKIGFTSGSLDKLRRAVDGTVNDMDLMKQANNAMMLGVVSSDEEMAQLFDTAQRLGQALGVETTDAVNSLVTGMGRQSKLMLDNLGITIDANTAYENYAEKIGVATEALDDNQKKLAFNEEVLRISGEMVDKLGEEVLDNATHFQQMESAVFNAGTALGEAFAPAVDLGAIAITKLANAIADAIMWVDTLERLYRQQFEVITDNRRELDAYIISVQNMTKTRILEEIQDMGIGFEKMAISTLAAKIASGELGQQLSKTGESTVVLSEQEEGLNNIFGDQGKHLEFLIQQYLLATEAKTFLQMSYDEFSVSMEEKIAADELEQQLMDQWIIKNRDKATEMGLMTKAEKDAIKTKKEMIKMEDEVVKNLMKAGRVFKEFKDVAKGVAVAQTLYDTYESAQAAYLSFVKSPKAKLNPIKYQILGIGAATAATAAGLARVDSIRQAQYGADFVTSGPQMMMVGEGSGPERVQVTPLVDENKFGPQGGGITLNISNPIMTDEFVEGEIIPKIREGIRLGENIGI
tara:strand:- start:709 stop:2490 length:1782 start_codon:yes stop_codon:yes gene_type:complete